MAKRGLSVAVSWEPGPEDTKVIGITYDGKPLPLHLTESQAVVKKQIGRLWKVPICQWPWPGKAPAKRRRIRRRA